MFATTSPEESPLMTARFSLPPPADVAAHFRQMVFGAVLHLGEAGERDGGNWPFLAAYRTACAASVGRADLPAAQWLAALGRQQGVDGLPFGRLARMGIAMLPRLLLASIAMVDEDPLLGQLLEPGGGYPTTGGLVAGWREGPDGDRAAAVRDAVTDLVECGLVELLDPDLPRIERRLRVPGPVLDALSGAPPRLEGARLLAAKDLPAPAQWLPPCEEVTGPERLGKLLAADPARLVLVRGPGRNGRRMLLRAAARVAGLNVLEVGEAVIADPARWQMAGTMAGLCGAMIVGKLEPGPGETVGLGPLRRFNGPIGLALQGSGAVLSEGALAAVTVALPAPDRAARERQWRACGAGALAATLAESTMTLGTIARAAIGARTAAELAGRKKPTRADVRDAARTLRDARLDALATPIDVSSEPEPLFLDPREQDEFAALLLRARHREALGHEHGRGRGVRALFAGPSGTGKTLAARQIASQLGKDVFRIDLAATVSKYIGETEKSLDRALSAAEERDIVLLLDEGDALMARRTDISSSNDRYANLETNFLLQRIESFDGIILVTSNDAGRIDEAFARRFDAVVTFRPPDAVTRLAILTSLLGQHGISPWLLDEVACRCQLTGGQLRNVILHARLLALDRGGGIDDEVLRAALTREYRKAGAFCPLKPVLAATG